MTVGTTTDQWRPQQGAAMCERHLQLSALPISSQRQPPQAVRRPWMSASCLRMPPAPAPMLPPGAPLGSMLDAPKIMGGGGGDMFATVAPPSAGEQMPPPAMGLMHMQASVPMAVLQPTSNLTAEPRTMSEMQAAAAPNPFVTPPLPTPQPQLQQQAMNPFLTQHAQPTAGLNPFLLAVPQQQAAPPVQKPPNPFDSLI